MFFFFGCLAQWHASGTPGTEENAKEVAEPFVLGCRGWQGAEEGVFFGRFLGLCSG